MKLDGMTLIALAFNLALICGAIAQATKFCLAWYFAFHFVKKFKTPARAHASARLVPHKPLILPQAFTQTTSRVTHEPLCLRPGRCPIGLLLGTLHGPSTLASQQGLPLPGPAASRRRHASVHHRQHPACPLAHAPARDVHPLPRAGLTAHLSSGGTRCGVR